MAEPTEADRRRAEAVCDDMPGVDFDDEGQSWREKVAYVAQALADERERARAPFVKVAEELDAEAVPRSADGFDQGLALGYSQAADRIHRAAEETGQ